MADLEASRIDRANHLILDQPLIRLPYELMRKNFRSAHFSVARESQSITDMLRETASGAINGRATPEESLKNIDVMLARAKGLKRKLAACAEEENRLYRQLDSRVSHLGELASMQTLEDVKYEQWSRRRLERLVVDYLLRYGYCDSAIALADERGIRDLVDIETFVQMRRIRDSLQDRSVTEALAWCTDNKKELRKMDSNLEFMLRFQQYIELVRSQDMQKLLEAIHHAKKYLIPFKDTYPLEVGQAAGLLAYPPGRTNESYGDLWSLDRWYTLAELFTETHYKLLALPSLPLLHVALSSGLSALKTPACHSAPGGRGDGLGGANDPAAMMDDVIEYGGKASNPAAGASAAPGSSMCPICSPELNELARNVPYAHHSKSHADNDLLMLPNGRVYGKARLEEYAKKSGLSPDQVRDLRTGQLYQLSKLKKVYIS